MLTSNVHFRQKDKSRIVNEYCNVWVRIVCFSDLFKHVKSINAQSAILWNKHHTDSAQCNSNIVMLLYIPLLLHTFDNFNPIQILTYYRFWRLEPLNFSHSIFSLRFAVHCSSSWSEKADSNIQHMWYTKTEQGTQRAWRWLADKWPSRGKKNTKTDIPKLQLINILITSSTKLPYSFKSSTHTQCLRTRTP